MPPPVSHCRKEMLNSLLSPQPARHLFLSSISSTSVMYFTRQLAAISGDLLVLSWRIRTFSARLMFEERMTVELVMTLMLKKHH